MQKDKITKTKKNQDNKKKIKHIQNDKSPKKLGMASGALDG